MADNALHEAARRGDVAAIRALTLAGAGLDARDDAGQAPLHVAACWCNPDAAATLAGLGADLSARDRYGRTPLDLARHRCNTEMIAALEDGKGQGSSGADEAGSDDSHLLSF